LDGFIQRIRKFRDRTNLEISMKLTRNILFETVAGLIAVGGAQAADLPVKAKAVEYVRVCSLYGAGFYYIPGSDTCIKLGGYLRVDAALNTNTSFNNRTNGTAGANNRLSNYYTARSREELNIDTRTATEYGVVRTYFDATFTWTTGNYVGTGSASGATQYSGTLGLNAAGTALVGSAGGSVNATDGNVSGGAYGVYHAFIQFAGFTMGRTVSPFDAPWEHFPGNTFDFLPGGGGTVTGVNQFAYTADFGQGVTAAIAAQDQTIYFQNNLWNVSGQTAAGILVGSYGANAYGGNVAPDIVGMVRVDQAWGLFQASVATHDNHVAYYGASETTGHPDDKWGWAAQLALSIKNIPTGVGDTLNIQGVYTNGASRYNFHSFLPTAYTMYGSSGLGGAYQSVGFAGIGDAVYSGTSTANGTGLELTTTYGFRGAFTHNWNPYWNTAVYGSWAALRFTNRAKALICSGVGFTALGFVGTCNPDFNVSSFGVITRWTPVNKLTFSADVAWTNLDQKYAGTVAPAVQSTIAKPSATYQLKDQNSVSMLLRAQRNW
jgi:hypothetical protein